MTFCVFLDDAGAATRELGGKARSLRRLATAGLPVPRAFAITADLFRALRAGGPPGPATFAGEADVAAALEAAGALADAPWPAGFARELEAALARLAPASRFSVRSSAALEDRADALGAGLFDSRTDIAAADVPGAVRHVLAGALAPAALAYAARRGLPAGELAMAVLVHPFTPGDAAGTAAHDADAQEAPTVDVASGTPSAAARARVVDAARTLAREAPVELEWVATGDDVVFLQQRPYRAPVRRAWSGAAALADATWTWDAAHNPLPLSPAQAGLVALVDARCRTPFRQRVVGGYLFSAPASAPPTSAATAPDAAAALRTLVRDADAQLARLGDDAPLDAVLDAFVSIYERLFGVVQPATRAARAALSAYLRAHGRAETAAELLRGVPSLAAERAHRADAIAATTDAGERAAAVASYVAQFGDEAPVWDVATPTYAEDPSGLHRLARAAATVDLPSSASSTDARAAVTTPASAAPPGWPADGRAVLLAARAAAAVDEDDDALYARVQARVRLALLREGRRLQAANLLARPDDVFWLPLELVRRAAHGDAALTAAAVTHVIAAARDAHAAALADPPPLPGARPGWDVRAGGVRGHAAASGRAIGPVHVHGSGDVPPGAVLVARTLLPTELPLLSPAAIIVETGGPLGHVAAQARERGLPAVVGAAGACAAFRQGDRVLVDGDAGVAIRLDG
jgi:phosphohistidine swiveling domain-containing protein